jgi:hypothetical protein
MTESCRLWWDALAGQSQKRRLGNLIAVASFNELNSTRGSQSATVRGAPRVHGLRPRKLRDRHDQGMSSKPLGGAESTDGPTQGGLLSDFRIRGK